jgi:hypothetical protein
MENLARQPFLQLRQLVGGDDNAGDVGVLAVKMGKELETVAAGHDQIGDDQGNFTPLQHGQRLLHIKGVNKLKDASVLGERCFYQPVDDFVVIHQ